MRRQIGRNVLTASLVGLCLGWALPASADIVITEWMYAGSSPVGGEFVEFTNVGDHPVDMTGWSFDDDARIPGTFDLSAFGIVAPGESVILTEDPAEDFRAAWNLGPEVRIVGDLGNPIGNNLGRNDEINLYDARGALVDRLTYGDQDFPGTIRTRWISGRPAGTEALGANDPALWVLSQVGDASGAWVSLYGDVGSPGVFLMDAPPPPLPTLVINEVMASNSETIADEDGDFEDWIELLNTGDRAISLEGLGLSDNPSNPFKWVLPEVTLEPGAYLLVFASGKNRTNPQGQLHTNYSISASGETLVITDPIAGTVDTFPATAMPSDISVGRQPDGEGAWRFFTEPTPGGPNITTGYDGPSPPVTFSHAAGFYTQAIELSLSVSDPRAIIHYTLDGSVPTASSPIYRGPITIDSRVGEPNDISMIPTNLWTSSPTYGWEPPRGEVFKVTPVRAIAVQPGRFPVAPTTRTYLIDPEIEERYTLPVISLTTDRANLFDHEIGLFVPGVHHVPGDHGTGNYFQEGADWERPVHIEFFEEDQSLAFAQDAGVRIHGGWTRRIPQKSLRLYARSRYGTDTFAHQLFPDRDDDSYRRFLLRPAGNDFFRTFFRDAMQQSLFHDAGLDTQAYRPAVVFINGEFWGIHNIRERQDRHYLARKYGADPERLDFLQNKWVVRDGTNTAYINDVLLRISNPPFEQIDTANKDLQDDERYDALTEFVDVEDYARYIAAQYFIRNTDWPQNNLRFWRPQEDGERWRWVTVDLDLGFGAVGGWTNDVFIRLALRNQITVNGFFQNWSTVLFRALLRNERFRHLFLNTFADLVNSVFRPEYVIDRIDEMQARIAPEMPEHIDRWVKIGSMTEWEEHVQFMREFAENRPFWAVFRVRQHFRGDYSMPPSEAFYIDPDFNNTTLTFVNPQPERGRIRVNTIEIDPGLTTWSGTYWITVPLPITAMANDGYVFAGWEEIEGSAGVETVLYTPMGPATLTARFEPATIPIPGDLNGDGVVDINDLLIVLGAWGPCNDCSACPGDTDGSCTVDLADLLFVLGNWSSGG